MDNNSIENDAESRNRSKAALLLVVVAVLWSSSGLLVKLIDWHPLAIAGMRSAVAALLLFLAAFRRLRLTWSFPQVGGALAYSALVILFVLSTKMTTAANAILLQYTAPVYTALLGAWFLKERVSKFDWGIIALVMGGMTLFFLDKLSPGNIWGNIAAVSSGIIFSCFILFMRMQKNESPLETVLLGNLLTALVSIPFMLQGAPGGAGWPALVFLGIFQLGLPFLLYSVAIKYVTALDAVLIQVIEPLLNPLWVFLVIGETPGTWALAGGLIVLGAVTGRSLVQTRQAINKRSRRRDDDRDNDPKDPAVAGPETAGGV